MIDQEHPKTRAVSRRMLLRGTLLIGSATTAILSVPGLAGRALAQDSERPPRLEPDLVKKFVGVSHSSLEDVKKLYEEQPALVNATWDWGGGDWETGLGAASHVGNKEIAEFLLSKGARMDVFAAVMLGKKQIFEAFLADDPEVIHLKGPHGISLIHHAERGGDAELIERINSLLDTEN